MQKRSKYVDAHLQAPISAPRRQAYVPTAAREHSELVLYHTLHLFSLVQGASMRLLSLLLSAVCAYALHASEAGVVDWHKPLAGIPLLQSPATAPTFHRREYENGATRSIILTATQSNVLAALNPANGSLGECALALRGGARCGTGSRMDAAKYRMAAPL